MADAAVLRRASIAILSDFDPETVKRFEKQFAGDEYTPGNQK